MSRRAQSAEMEFGSDSFLDIVANLVGVLIILIVIMGIRVGAQARENARRQVVERTPAVVEKVEAVPVVSAPLFPSGPTQEDLAARQQQNAAIEQDNLRRRQHFELQQQKQQALEMEFAQYEQALRQMGGIDQQNQIDLQSAQTALQDASSVLEQLDQSLNALQQKEDQLSGTVAIGQGKLRDLDAQTKATFAKLLNEQAVADALKTEIASLTAQQAEMRQQIEDQFARAQSHLAVLQKLGDQPASTKTITHQMTSMGAIVVKEESHFRLLNGRISYVPVLELVELVKKEMAESREKLLRGEPIHGVVGPLSGYSMRFKASRQQISVVDELRMGGGMVRISVDYWELFDAGTDESEPLEIAKMPNSMFIDRIRALNANEKSVTMWVYPDSYDLYQALRGQVEKAGLTVAARPLPHGVPIAGSPSGMKSLSQ